jgi:hypothetical protein
MAGKSAHRPAPLEELKMARGNNYGRRLKSYHEATKIKSDDALSYYEKRRLEDGLAFGLEDLPLNDDETEELVAKINSGHQQCLEHCGSPIFRGMLESD